MSGVLADTSVVLDVFQDDPRWCTWSLSALRDGARRGRLFIDPIIHAEVSVGFARIEELERAIDDAGLAMLPIPKEALFLAAKAYLRYRRQRGTKTAPLPDFFIGAHAAVEGLTLVTRNPRRVREYFPTVRLVAPAGTA